MNTVVDIQSVASKPSQQHVEMAAMLKKWGWSGVVRGAPASIVKAAEFAVELRRGGVQSGEAVVRLGLLTAERRDALLAAKPKDQKFLEYAATLEPRLRPYVEKVLALKAGYAYYDDITDLTVHACMYESTIQAQCHNVDAVVMRIDGRVPVVVFSSYDRMLKYSTAGREEKARDIIRREVLSPGEDDVITAIASQQAVIDILSSTRSDPATRATVGADHVLLSSAMDKPEQKQLARLLDYAISQDASNIEIMPSLDGSSRNYMRCLGDMIPCGVPMFSQEECEAITRFLAMKSEANPNGGWIFRPLDGQVDYKGKAGYATLRMSFIPSNHRGVTRNLVSISIRLQIASGRIRDLNELGLQPLVRDEIATAAKLESGFILVVGVPNSGKSTTMHGVAAENYNYYGMSKVRLSLEQPVEQKAHYIFQVEVNELFKDAHGQLVDGFAYNLRAFRRHDPDMIMVGEIRDKETAYGATMAAVNGSLVLASMHAKNTLLGYSNLLTLIPSEKRADLLEVLTLVAAQHLARKVCTECGVVSPPTDDERRMFEYHKRTTGLKRTLPDVVRHLTRGGCDCCNKRGFTEIVPIVELLPITEDVRSAMFAQLAGENKRDFIASQRMNTLFGAAMDLVEQQIIPLGDALV